MIEKIIDGILSAIHGEFGDGYKLYTEEVKQGLKTPCFFILCINPNIKRFRGQRYLHSNQFMIQYLTDNKDIKAEHADVAERLYSCLEYITVDGDLMAGKDMSVESMDEVLNFGVNYDMFTYRPKAGINMEEFAGAETSVKG